MPLIKLQVLGLPVVVDWDRIRVGESFFVPAPLGITQQLKRQLLDAAAKTDRALCVEEVAEKGLTGIRVWRIR
jgi:hypothetical protein